MAETNEEKHLETYRAAEAALRALDPAQVAATSGVAWEPATAGRPATDPADAHPGRSDGPEAEAAGRLEIPAFGRVVHLSWPDLAFSTPAPLPLVESFPWRLIALHYLAGATGEIPGADWISYRDLPDGLFYANTVTREVEEPLARLYGSDPEGFLAAGIPLGAAPLPLADVALEVSPLPRVPLVFALWREDEEFPAKVKVLYERSGAANLPLQDLRIIAELAGQVLLAGSAGGAGPAGARGPAGGPGGRGRG